MDRRQRHERAQAALAKRNRQLPEDSPAAKQAGEIVLDALGRNSLFMAAALPAKVWPPLFNRYGGGEQFGMHVDNAVRIKRGGAGTIAQRFVRDVVSARPGDYEGGELTVEDTYGAHAIKLGGRRPDSLSRFEPAPRDPGDFAASAWPSFFWVQSMIRDDAQRRVLFDMDVAVQRLARRARPSARFGRGVDWHVSQPAADVGGGLVFPSGVDRVA